MTDATSHARSARAELVAAIQGISTLLGELDGEALEVGFERYCYVVDTLEDVVSGLGAARVSVDAIAGVSADPTDDEVTRLRRELEEAKVALGWAWLRDGASLAEGIRRKTAFLEGLIPVCEETDRAQVEALALVRESGELREAAIGQRDVERNRRIEAERERDEARTELSAMREAAGMFRRCQHPDCRGGTRILDNGMRFRCDTCGGRGLVEVSHG